MSQLQVSDDGVMIRKSELSEPLEITDSITAPTSSVSSRKITRKRSKQDQESSTLESRPTTRKRICKGKSRCSKKTTPTTNSSPILDPDSTTTERAFRGFWNESTMEMSTELWLPIKTDCVAMDWNLLSSSSKKLVQNSWFTAEVTTKKESLENSQMISSRFVTTLLQKTMGGGQPRIENEDTKRSDKKEDQEQIEMNIEIEEKVEKKKIKKSKKGKKGSQNKKKNEDKEEKIPAGKAKKIKLRLTAKQKSLINQWFDTARWTYNQVVQGINEGVVKDVLSEVRSKYVNNCNYPKGTDNAWVTHTPYEIRDAAMVDARLAFKTNFAKQKKNPSHTFHVKFKSKKAATDSIVIQAKKYTEDRKIHVEPWDGYELPPLKGYEPLPTKLGYTTRLQRTRWGEYYLCVLSPLDPPHDDSEYENQGSDQNVMALDPGMRTFMTGYGSDGKVMECGRQDINRIYRLCYAFDNLQSRWSSDEVRHRRRYKMRRAGARIHKKIRNLVDELHKKLVKWLVLNYRLVLLPRFETQDMVKKFDEFGDWRGRKIRSKTARAMLTWSHYRFQQRLLNKTREYTKCHVVICDEHYTSKTCGSCGYLHEKLGSNKTFHCPMCDVVLDRDMNAARNILLRYMTLQSQK